MDTMALIRGILLLVILCTASGCSPQPERGEESRQEYVESVMAILTQVQKNLNRIHQKTAVVERLSSTMETAHPQSAEDVGKDIFESIRFIDSTLESSRQLIARLEEENRVSQYRVESVDQLTLELRQLIEDKDLEIGALKEQVAMLDEQVAELHETVDVLDEFILEQEDRLSFAYYISGSYQELARKGVLTASSNSIAGMFSRTYSMSGDFDISQFERIDIFETRDLFFESPKKSLRIVTPHSIDSYELIGGGNSSLLLIKDENEFWRKSRCLVIVEE